MSQVDKKNLARAIKETDLLNFILVVSQTGIGIRQKIRISSKKMV